MKSKKLKSRVKASSLINAIFVCLLVSILCGSLVLLSSYQQILGEKLSMGNKLIADNNSAFNLLLSSMDKIPYNTQQNIEGFRNETKSIGIKKKWGGYDILVSKTYHRLDTITKTALVGKRDMEFNTTALYLANYATPLKISGKTVLIGDIKVPGGTVENAFIDATHQGHVLRGKKDKSDRGLPDIKKVELDYNLLDFEEIDFNDVIRQKEIVRGFDKKTLLVRLNDIEQISSLTFKGNVMIESSNKILIAEDVNLKDVIIKAPEVIFKSGFQGNVQVLAEKKVILEKNTKLLYPSVIMASNNLDSVSVVLKKESLFIGDIIVTGSNIYDAKKRSIVLEEDAKLVGRLFCTGYTELKGKVYGRVFTNWFNLKTQTSVYENVLHNSEINLDSLPKEMVQIPLFDFNQEKNSVVVKKL